MNSNFIKFLKMKNIFTTLISIAVFNAIIAQTADTWVPKAAYPDAGSISTVAFTLGGKIYYGTGYNQITCTNDFWQYDPANDTWTQRTGMPGGNRTGAVSFSVNNKGYVALGTDCNFNPYQDVWQYDADADQWIQMSNFGGASRRFAVGFAIDTMGYIATGASGNVFYTDIWQYNPTTDQWTQKADMPPAGRSNASAFVIGNKGYIGLGYNGTNALLDFWAYDPATNAWAPKANYQGTAVNAAYSFSIGGHGYCGDGSTLTVNKDDFWEYDTATDTWAQRTKPGIALAYGSGVAVNNVGYFIGGEDSTSTYQNLLLQYTPLTTGVSLLQPDANVSLFPNPCSNYIACKNLPFNDGLELSLYDAVGNKVLSQTCNSTEYTLVLPGILSKGIYTLKVTSGDTEPLSYKVVKE